MTSLRTKKGCSNPGTAPASCACVANTEPLLAACGPQKALWQTGSSLPKEWTGMADTCIKVTPDQFGNWSKHDFAYPSNYGNACGQSGKEPGSYDCTWVSDTGVKAAAKTHIFEDLAEGLRVSGYNTAWNSTTWCSSSWCWVDPCACSTTDITASTWLDGHYSFAQCGAEDSYTAAAACDVATTEGECTIIDKCKWTTSALIGYASSVKIGIVSVLLLLSFAN